MLLKIPWIISWMFEVTPSSGPSPPLLQRICRVKWWDKLPKEQIKRMTIQGISDYYSINFGVPATIEQPLYSLQQSEEDEIAQIMAVSSKEEAKRLLQEIKRSSPTNSTNAQESPRFQDPFQDVQDPYPDITQGQKMLSIVGHNEKCQNDFFRKDDKRTFSTVGHLQRSGIQDAFQIRSRLPVKSSPIIYPSEDSCQSSASKMIYKRNQ